MTLLYAIAHSMERAHFFLEGKVPLIQLRFKNQSLLPYKNQITEWILQYRESHIIINDNPEFAIAVNAWGTHLGQEDLQHYQPENFFNTTLKLGISTHSVEEWHIAQKFKPAYVGYGPIFPTQTKTLNYSTHGMEGLTTFVQKVPTPVVAIGGISADKLKDVLKANPWAIAMISGLDHLQTQEDLFFLQRTFLSISQQSAIHT
ncbi:MAG: thiamine phosphate synthase [SAR324 cluster bacterium]|nr:thiamine phosphate synthase [SAR324 cluster bacterium]